MELNSRGEVLSLTDSKLLIRGIQGVSYLEDQPELADWRLLDGLDAFILRLMVLRECFRGGDWLLDVNLP